MGPLMCKTAKRKKPKELLLDNNGKMNFAEHAAVTPPFSSTPTLITFLQYHLHPLHLYSQQHSKKPVRSPFNRLGGPIKSHIVLTLFIWRPDIKRYMNSCSFLGPYPAASRGRKSKRVAERRMDWACRSTPPFSSGSILMRTRTPSPARSVWSPRRT